MSFVDNFLQVLQDHDTPELRDLLIKYLQQHPEMIESHREKLQILFRDDSRGRKIFKESIQFHWPYGGQALICGDFTDWRAKDLSQTFQVEIGIEYKYHFLVDGERRIDPNARNDGNYNLFSYPIFEESEVEQAESFTTNFLESMMAQEKLSATTSQVANQLKGITRVDDFLQIALQNICTPEILKSITPGLPESSVESLVDILKSEKGRVTEFLTAKLQ